MLIPISKVIFLNKTTPSKNVIWNYHSYWQLSLKMLML